MVILNVIQCSPNYQTTLEFPISLKNRLFEITMTPLFVIMVNKREQLKSNLEVTIS